MGTGERMDADADAEFKGSYIKNFQGVIEPYTQLIARLTDAVQVRRKETQQYLIRQLAFENANEDCQTILHPIRKRDVMGCMKACQNIGSISHQAHVNVLGACTVLREARGPDHLHIDYKAPPNHVFLRPPLGPVHMWQGKQLGKRLSLHWGLERQEKRTTPDLTNLL